MPTRRERLRELLLLGRYTPKDLAHLTEAKIVDVVDDLEHLRKSVGRSFKVSPAFCDGCEFTFADRRRLSTPSRCPKCRAERIAGPWLTIEEKAGEREGGRAAAEAPEDVGEPEPEH